LVSLLYTREEVDFVYHTQKETVNANGGLSQPVDDDHVLRRVIAREDERAAPLEAFPVACRA
jgi:hypothetical protein